MIHTGKLCREGKPVFDILVLTEETKPFEEVIEIFKKEFFKIEVKTIHYIDYHSCDLHHYDFILIRLDYLESINEHLIKTIKSRSQCPLYIFAKNHTDHEKASLMEYGAEGHIDIPFSSSVVAARIKAVLRFINTIKKVKDNTIKIGTILIDLDNYSIDNNGSYMNLTNVEHKILKILLENKDHTVTKDEIIRYVWDDDTSATDNALGIQITRLRKKINCGDQVDIIETIWGIGYRFNFKLCESSYSK
jgi:DNA-binding response OmpR family regulator